ncbi:DUF3683 domain-containing protein [Magnetovibrio sp. PR-2]|uniref:DUF3683 domain-containing protein n=1 Tax=Magnetovibrio sp. PR-2 TaxID=3120356 RepID=UPI002FCE0F75
MSAAMRIREIPYNYTSYSDREIIIRLLGEEMWDVLNGLREQRRTGRSARMLFEVLGDIWIVRRNPFVQDDLQDNAKRLRDLEDGMYRRLDEIDKRAQDNEQVQLLAARAREAVVDFYDWLKNQKKLRRRVESHFKRHTRKDHVDFSGEARVAHVTDATDWRVEYPLVVLTPGREDEIAPLVQDCIELGLTVIPRGGGTGYTGSAVPLYSDTAVLNTEKMDFIEPVEVRTIPGREEPVSTIRVGAGAVTKRVAEAAEKVDAIFAVDPTSQNSSTIGGNISMNAGGKKAVMWGTTLDNLLSWRMVTPDADWIEVTRLDHNMGKIHDMDEVQFQVEHFAADGVTPKGDIEVITLKAADVRKPGLGKDVTNKFLGGLPGVQKEGCDGLITSAVFVLHPKPKHIRTLCLEFYGKELGRAVPAIVETLDYLKKTPGVGCAGLEHLDQRYIRAVGYSPKSQRNDPLKMVLVADIVGEEETAVVQAAKHIVELTVQREGEGFIATKPAARARFWADRSRTAAIAAHTNAFKINEDVVIPIERMADYSEGIERFNIEQSITNKIRLLEALESYLDQGSFMDVLPKELVGAGVNADILAGKKETSLQLLEMVAERWTSVLHNLDGTAESCTYLPHYAPDPGHLPDDWKGLSIERLMLRGDIRISYREEIERPLKSIWAGDQWTAFRDAIDEIHKDVLSSRLFVALHMHAGDGNVHTNIPVNSNDYAMLQEAEHLVDRIMHLAQDLGGVISGEHGIGLTKFDYLEPEKIEDFRIYKEKVDPEGRFNRGKLMAQSKHHEAYTPSLRLVQQEALIMKDSAFEILNDMTRHCLRCGKCKEVCSTHVPGANLLYSPRNKILSLGLIIEAFLYEEQTRRGVSQHHFDVLNDVADHCTVCNKCEVPCPVNIDFGDVTVKMREILLSRGKKQTAIGAKLAMAFLTTSNDKAIRVIRSGFIRGGYAGQNLMSTIAKATGALKEDAEPLATTGAAPLSKQLSNMLRTPLPLDKVPNRTARDFLELRDDGASIPVIKPLGLPKDAREAVFYFPGCGCERLFSHVSLATIAMLNAQGVQVVLPPSQNCCGFPQKSAGDAALGQSIATSNRVQFHRVANILGYLDIKNVIVSCGTCHKQLTGYAFDQIFPGSRLMDIHEFLFEKNVKLQAQEGEAGYLFHDPCHTPFSHYDPMEVASELMGQPTKLTERCCGESGTFAVSRPDISTQVKYSKANSIAAAALDNQAQTGKAPQKVLTACPSCLQGLSRFENAPDAEFMVVELARKMLGENWQRDFLNDARNGGVEYVVL